MIIPHLDCYFHLNLEDEFNIHIFLSKSEDIDSSILWGCNLRGLWKDPNERETVELVKIWDLHKPGDYFQQTLIKHKSLHPQQSYTSWFHNMLRLNREETRFVTNLYSTSTLNGLSMGYSFSPDAERFWKKQAEKKLAAYCDEKKRFQAKILI